MTDEQDMAEEVQKAMARAKQISEIKTEIERMLNGFSYSEKMSMASMFVLDASIEEYDTAFEALAGIANFSNALVTTFSFINRIADLEGPYENEDEDQIEEKFGFKQ